MIGEVNRATVIPGGDFADQAFANALLKHDLAHGNTEAHEFGRDATAGEAVFAPAGPGADEDDGYVMAFVHNPGPRRRRPGHPRGPGLHRRASRPRPPARPDPARVPRQLDPGPLNAGCARRPWPRSVTRAWVVVTEVPQAQDIQQ